ncbi:MAG: isoprenylcysteine carboxylmethyltransferase family protein [Anaerolineales bacterium]
MTLFEQTVGRTLGSGAASRSWPVVLLISAGFIGAGILLWHPLPLAFYNRISWLFSAIGALFYYPGTGIYLWGLATLRAQFGVSSLSGADLYQGHKLITRGPFAIIRHPMYVGVFLAAIGALLIFRTWAIALFAPMSLVVLVRANHEEELLAAEFGEEWETYASKVPKWFPKKEDSQVG